jgi:hypothetical protein
MRPIRGKACNCFDRETLTDVAMVLDRVNVFNGITGPLLPQTLMVRQLLDLNDEELRDIAAVVQRGINRRHEEYKQRLRREEQEAGA